VLLSIILIGALLLAERCGWMPDSVVGSNTPPAAGAGPEGE
jgi:hypothetical protein